MKRFSPAKFALAAVCALGLAAATSVRADTIAQWTFETGAPSATPSAWNGSAGVSGQTPGMTFASDLSTYGSGAASGYHATAGTLWVSPVGNGSLRALSANQWLQASDYYQFTFTPSAAGTTFTGINLTWDQTASSSGPKNWNLNYSTDGVTWNTSPIDYSLAYFSWNSSTVQGNNESTIFSGATETALENTLYSGDTVYFRLVDDSAVSGGALNGGNVGTGGTSRVDNFTIIATIPEPSSLSLLGGFGLLAWHLIRRRK
jgi:hypothetical protein